MLGLMMNRPLPISSLIRHADRCHGDGEIVSRNDRRARSTAARTATPTSGRAGSRAH